MLWTTFSTRHSMSVAFSSISQQRTPSEVHRNRPGLCEAAMSQQGNCRQLSIPHASSEQYEGRLEALRSAVSLSTYSRWYGPPMKTGTAQALTKKPWLAV